MKFSLVVALLLVALCVATFATPVPKAAELNSLQKERQRLRKLKRNTRSLRKLSKRFTSVDDYNKNTLTGPASAAPCDRNKLDEADGTQSQGRTCASTQMGEIPDVNSMTSQLIVNPKNGDDIDANTKFTVQVKVANLETGNFDDPATQYYIFSQQLNKQGFIKGHSHITIQKLNGDNLPNAKEFAFFKGLNDPADNGVLSVAVEDGLKAQGEYRICTMGGSFAHQPLIMPVAQRGAQDDCIRINIK